MRTCIASLTLYLIFALHPALAQVSGEPPPRISLALEEQGTPIGKGAPGEVNVSAEALREGGMEIPTSRLARIMAQPVVESTAQARGAADA
jgi:hypothetical protein